MATFNPVSSSLRFSLNAGSSAGKSVVKTASLNGIDPAASAADLSAVAAVLKGLFMYPAAATKKHDVSLLTE